MVSPYLGERGFQTLPSLRYNAGTSSAKINALPHSGGRLQSCAVLRKALNLPFPEQGRSMFATIFGKPRTSEGLTCTTVSNIMAQSVLKTHFLA